MLQRNTCWGAIQFCLEGLLFTVLIHYTMWYDKLGIISIGCQNGGPEDGGLGDIKVALWRLFIRHCRSTYCSGIAHYALVLRVDGEFQHFGSESIGHIQRNKRDRFIAADIVVPDAVWRGKSPNQLRDYLAKRVREALQMCVARLRKDKEVVDESSFFREVDTAIHEYTTMDFSSAG